MHDAYTPPPDVGGPFDHAPEPRRVLIVTYEYPPLGGGGGVIFRDLAEALSQRMEVTVLTSWRQGLPRRERFGLLDIVRVPVLLRGDHAVASLPSMLSFVPGSVREGRALVAQQGFDLVHTSFAVPSGPGGIRLARVSNRPHLLTVHGGDVYDPTKLLSPHRTPLLRQTVRWVIHASDAVVAQSADIERRVRSIYGAPRVERIPLAAWRPALRTVSRAALGWSTKWTVLMTVGRLIPRKGLDQLLSMVRGLEDSSVHLVIAGEGPLRERLRDQSRALGIARRVHFEGRVSEARKWQMLERADLYVSTTQHEGFGIVFLEAMLVGLPVVAYDEGGQRDFLDDDVGGLIQLNDLPAFTRRVLQLVRAPGLRRAVSSSARRRAQGYDVGRLADRYHALYRRLLAARAGSGSRLAPSALP